MKTDTAFWIVAAVIAAAIMLFALYAIGVIGGTVETMRG